jgi:hypothetical protein
MVTKLTRLTHKIAIQLHVVAESCTVSSSRSRRPVWKLLDTPSYNQRTKTIVAYTIKVLLSVWDKIKSSCMPLRDYTKQSNDHQRSQLPTSGSLLSGDACGPISKRTLSHEARDPFQWPFVISVTIQTRFLHVSPVNEDASVIWSMQPTSMVQIAGQPFRQTSPQGQDRAVCKAWQPVGSNTTEVRCEFTLLGARCRLHIVASTLMQPLQVERATWNGNGHVTLAIWTNRNAAGCLCFYVTIWPALERTQSWYQMWNTKTQRKFFEKPTDLKDNQLPYCKQI